MLYKIQIVFFALLLIFIFYYKFSFCKKGQNPVKQGVFISLYVLCTLLPTLEAECTYFIIYFKNSRIYISDLISNLTFITLHNIKTILPNDRFLKSYKKYVINDYVIHEIVTENDISQKIFSKNNIYFILNNQGHILKSSIYLLDKSIMTILPSVNMDNILDDRQYHNHRILFQKKYFILNSQIHKNFIYLQLSSISHDGYRENMLGILHDLNNMVTVLTMVPNTSVSVIQQTILKILRVYTEYHNENYEINTKIPIYDTVRKFIQYIGMPLTQNKITLTGFERYEEHYTLMNETQLDRILLNIIINARDASIGYRLQINVHLQVVQLKNTYLSLVDSVVTGKFLMITVTDYGKGVDTINYSSMLSPYVSTKKKGGLGLHIVWNILKQIKGYIDCRSKVGEYTSMYIYIPITNVNNLSVSRENHKRILIVEDNNHLAESMKTYLKNKNHQVFLSCDYMHIQNMILQQKIDLIILDNNFSNTHSGKDVVNFCRKNNSKIFIIATSPILLSYKDSFLHHMHKPFTLEELYQYIISRRRLLIQ